MDNLSGSATEKERDEKAPYPSQVYGIVSSGVEKGRMDKV